MLEGWIVEPSREVKAAAARLQESLRRFGWIDLVPEHFLHVWLGLPERLGLLPVELVLVSHGEPVLEDGADALRRGLA